MNCECKACLAALDQRTEPQRLIAHVHTHGLQATPGFWVAYAQGYLAALEGRPSIDLTPYRCHSVDFEFRRGHADGIARVPYVGVQS